MSSTSKSFSLPPSVEHSPCYQAQIQQHQRKSECDEFEWEYGLELDTPVDILPHAKKDPERQKISESAFKAMLQHRTSRDHMIKMASNIVGEEVLRYDSSQYPNIVDAYLGYLSDDREGTTVTQRLTDKDLRSRSIPQILSKTIQSPSSSSSTTQPVETSKAGKIAWAMQKQSSLRLNQNSQYRDVGGGNGAMAKELSEVLGLSKKGDDLTQSDKIKVYEIADYTKPLVTTIKLPINGKIPDEDNSVDFATCNMVMHHVQDVDTWLDELHRVLKPGATFVMRETDTEGDLGIIGFQHIMDQHWYNSNCHSSTVSGVPLSMQFRDADEIRHVFAKHGLRLRATETHPEDDTSVFHPKIFIFENIKE